MGISISSALASYSGTAAARPAATNVPAGAVYFATDTGLLSRSDGTTWTTIQVGAASLLDDSVGGADLAAAQRFINATGTFDYTLGRVGIINRSSGSVVTLPAALAGRVVELENISTGTNVAQLQCAGTDTFFSGATTMNVAPKGGAVRLVCAVNGAWVPIWRVGELSTQKLAADNTTANSNALSVTVTGDGFTPVRVRAEGFQTLSAIDDGGLILRDGTTDLRQTRGSIYAAGAYLPHAVSVVVSPFAGSKTFNVLNWRNGASTPTLKAGAFVRVEWAPGATPDV